MVKLSTLEEKLENLDTPLPLGDFISLLGLDNNRETRVMVSAAIRLGGYRAERVVTWNPELKRTVTDIFVFPKEG